MDSDLTDADQAAVAWTRALLALSHTSGERFAEEWKVVRRRIELLHRVSLARETDPAVSPRLDTGEAVHE